MSSYENIVLEKMHMGSCWWVSQMTKYSHQKGGILRSEQHLDFEKNADSTTLKRQGGDSNDVGLRMSSLTPPGSVRNLHIHIIHIHLPSSSMVGWQASTYSNIICQISKDLHGRFEMHLCIPRCIYIYTKYLHVHPFSL